MIRRSIACIAVLFGVSAHCFGNLGDVSTFIEYHWNTFSNVDRPQIFHSTTNLPTEVRSNILEYQSDVITELVKELHNGKGDMASIANTFKLDWAATDGTNYVVHWEIAPASPEQNLCMAGSWPCTCITAAMREPGGTNYVISTGQCSIPLKGCNEFIEYERYEACVEVRYPL